MIPLDFDEPQGYEYEAPLPLVKTLVGDPPEHLNAYDVSCLFFGQIVRLTNNFTALEIER